LYLSVPVSWLVRFIELDKTHVAHYLATRKLYLAKSMTTMMQGALQWDDWDRLLVYEADMMPPSDAINRIAHYPDELDIVGSVYFQHAEPHHPIVYTQVDEGHYAALQTGQVDAMIDKPGIYPVDAVGFGFTSIHRRVIEQWNPDIPLFDTELELGHDMAFCRSAKKQGWSVTVDSGIICGHLTEIPIYGSLV
jgi:hypothetical protein